MYIFWCPKCFLPSILTSRSVKLRGHMRGFVGGRVSSKMTGRRARYH